MSVRDGYAMKAAVLHEFKTPLTLEEVSRPEAGADEVVIEVEVCGVCHSDLHVADGDWTQLAGIVKKPLILGHEIVGRVVERGAAVTSIQVGDRVGVPWVQWTCGQCEFCREGNENLCVRQRLCFVRESRCIAHSSRRSWAQASDWRFSEWADSATLPSSLAGHWERT